MSLSKTKFYQNAYLFLALGFIIVMIGFSKTYFTRLTAFSFPYHLHGVSATLWMLLLIIQPLLYKTGRLKAHRILGWASLILVPTIIIGGIIMMRLMIQGQENYPPNTVYQLAFIDVLTLFGFAVLYALAIYHRKNLMLHSRFMVATIFGPLLPASTRMFMFNLGVASNFNEGLTYSYLLVELVLLLMIWLERKKKEIKLTYVPLFIFIVVQHVLMYYANDWGWWQSLMNQFAGYSG